MITAVSIVPTKVWIENGLGGERHVMIQHEGHGAFTYATFFYNYGYTDNATTHKMATDLAVHLGATEPIEYRQRIGENL
jgi:hypothetical protein